MNGLPSTDSPAVSSADKAKKRISQRDAVIRKKFEQQSAIPRGSTSAVTGNGSSPSTLRRNSATYHSQKQHHHQQQHNHHDPSNTLIINVKPGTVAAMHPAVPIVLSENTLITEVARTMAGRRVDAILITDDKGSGQLKGIVTDKDLAFRCVAEGLDAHRTKIQQIMTQDPVYVSSEATVDIAINKMLQGHFRHLPVVDHNRIVGLLDITKVLLHIQSKIQNSWGKANALKSAFQEFQTTWQNFAATPEVQDWFQEWSDKMIEPNLLQVMNVNCPMPEVGLKSTVREAARVMKDTRQTAVLVYDPSHELAGIFTTKDICLRVLAPNDCDPRSTSVVRVMTPHPDCVGEDTTVRDALRKMHDGHYLHLPVRSASSSRIIGLIDVLTLTYSTMEQLATQQSMTLSPLFGGAVNQHQQASDQQHPQQPTQPVWSKFFENTEMYRGRNSDENSQKGGTVGDRASADSHSVTGSQSATTVVPGIVNGSAFVFKFRDPLTGMVHRFTSRAVTGDFGESPLAELLEIVVQKCGCEIVMINNQKDTMMDFDPETLLMANNPSAVDCIPRDQAISKQYQNNYFIKARPVMAPVIMHHSQPTDINDIDPDNVYYLFRISYKDDEGDLISIHNDSDLLDAITVAKTMGWGRIMLKIELIMEVNGRQYPVDDGSLALQPEEEEDELRSRVSMPPAVYSTGLFRSVLASPLLWGAGIGVATVGIVALVAIVVGKAK